MHEKDYHVDVQDISTVTITVRAASKTEARAQARSITQNGSVVRRIEPKTERRYVVREYEHDRCHER